MDEATRSEVARYAPAFAAYVTAVSAAAFLLAVGDELSWIITGWQSPAAAPALLLVSLLAAGGWAWVQRLLAQQRELAAKAALLETLVAELTETVSSLNRGRRDLP